MQNFDAIRPYHDHEVQDVLQNSTKHPMVKALLNFTFPNKTENEVADILSNCHSIKDFQSQVIYHSVQNVLARSCEQFTTSGFDKLDPNQSYLYISNHRDIILDTSLLNVALLDHKLIMTASAIGSNLVKKPFLMSLSRLNRNFMIMRDLAPREMLKSSQLVSDYIKHLLLEEKRSVWIAQREGRTKDGNDQTQQGVLKMITKAAKGDPFEYLKKVKIVPVSISYEYDPTDILKIPELLATKNQIEYIKTNNEDFNSILQGAAGNKKRIHIAAGAPLSKELTDIQESDEPLNKKLLNLKNCIDHAIYRNYKLWPSNYIAYDLLHQTDIYGDFYDEKEKRQFDRRVERRVNRDNKQELEQFLAMYANPVINAKKLQEISTYNL
ncbi:1-acyl-sn-glycerol-3-phosphate acyltransferase [Spongiivirga citrea]|uniref:1-acyl-sn-glycerol-3-phosphate acyltransferase n=1 Tax=Spongiivirga citrea TaxID=1481457 RepID=A0A6M0CK42_9FLAO|nr:1-acyl-sn-glycerol-3-phosphate acyltransferase [Spongiivirga citrea]NER17992.1 1-acyl-sn-glycerol-3-phosphate acyltransferase [Spongiivirga citrea]